MPYIEDREIMAINNMFAAAEFYEDNKTFYSESSDCPIHDVTHWRPIERS